MARLAEVKTYTQKGFSEFKAFIQRGNVIDLAVAVIIGAAFGKIVTSLVNEIITPPIGVATTTFYEFVSGHVQMDVTSPWLVHVGRFLQTVVDFLIVAFCVFLLVKGVTTLQKRFINEEPKPAELTTQEKLLAEIRDLLKAQQEAKGPPVLPILSENLAAESPRPV